MPRSMYLRMVFGSRPVRRAMAVIETPLAMQFQDHHQLSKSNHRRLPARGTWRRWRLDHSARTSPDRMIRKERQSGNFQSPLSGRIAGPMTLAYGCRSGAVHTIRSP